MNLASSSLCRPATPSHVTFVMTGTDGSAAFPRHGPPEALRRREGRGFAPFLHLGNLTASRPVFMLKAALGSSGRIVRRGWDDPGQG
jgi:hypothetical protein